jgi:hypothetical protein
LGEAMRQLDLLREVVQGGLGVGSGGKAARGQQVGNRACRTHLLWFVLSYLLGGWVKQ